MSSSPAHIVSNFLEAFMSGDMERASSLVRDDFSFRAPLQQGTGGKAEYFGGAEEKARFIREFRILRQWADGNQVSTLYDIEIGTAEDAATMAISEWHTVREGQIASTFMVFDSDAPAAHLMADALGAHHH